jgi:two-component system NtrC family sensor kinase
MMRRRRRAQRGSAQPQEQGAEGASRVEDIGVPFRHRLSTKLLGMTALVALAALAAVWVAERRMARDLQAQLTRSTALLADAIEATTELGMVSGLREHAYDALRRVADLETVERIRVIDKAGKVVFSTAEGDVGSMVGIEAPVCGACHRSGHPQPLSVAPAAERAEIVSRAGTRTLVLVAPVHNGHSCSTAACHAHPPGRQVLGLFELRVSLGTLDAAVLEFRRGVVVVLSILVLVVALLLYLFGRSEVVEPVAALVEGTHRVARDELDVEIRVRSRGELGVLASSFNEMTRSLRDLEGELEGMMDGLELEVEARTAELRQANEQLVRTEKLSSLGKLSASIAHEINNPLAGILTFAKLVSRTLADGAPDDERRATLQKHLALIERETQRCSTIVKNLLDFARERPLQQKLLDVRAPLEEALSLIDNQFRTQGVGVEWALEPVPLVVADFGQLRQAFVNIAMNGCEAMGRGGTLRVTTGERDGFVEVVLSDNGPGIPAERLSHIFDPFYTTKEKGTGLGLSVVYGVVQKHEGTIAVDSEVGRGTTFTIRLPIPAQTSAAEVGAA